MTPVRGTGANTRSMFLPWFAGLCVGLHTGAIALGATFALGQPSEAVAITLRYLLGGFLVLLPISLVVGYPLAHWMRMRQHRRGEAALIVAGAAILTAAVLGLIIGTLTAQIANSVLVLTAAGAWCLAFAIPLSAWFQARRGAALAVALVTTAAATLGALLVLSDLAL